MFEKYLAPAILSKIMNIGKIGEEITALLLLFQNNFSSIIKLDTLVACDNFVHTLNFSLESAGSCDELCIGENIFDGILEKIIVFPYAKAKPDLLFYANTSNNEQILITVSVKSWNHALTKQEVLQALRQLNPASFYDGQSIYKMSFKIILFVKKYFQNMLGSFLLLMVLYQMCIHWCTLII